MSKRACVWLLASAACGSAARPAPLPPPPPLEVEPQPAEGIVGRAWLDEVHDELHPRWALGFLEQSRVYLPPGHALNDLRLEVTLRFSVGREGQVTELEVAKPSGNADFDGAAKELITEAAPLPIPPPELVSDDGVVHVTWRFARDVRQDGVAGASIERRQWEVERAVPALLAGGRVADAAARLADAYQGNDRRRLAREVAGATLVAALEDVSDPAARDVAAEAAAATGWIAAEPALRRLALEANDLGVQSAAIRALGTMRDDQAPPIFHEALARFDDERSVAAAGALARLGKGGDVWTRESARAKGADSEARVLAFQELTEVGAEDSAQVLIEALRDRERPRPERTTAAVALAPLARDPSSPAARALLTALDDGDAAVRAAAAGALARAGELGMRSSAAARELTQLLVDRDPHVQEAGARAVAWQARRGTLDELARLARSTSDPTVVEAAVGAIGRIVGSEAFSQLRRFVASKDEVARMAALRALAGRPEPEAAAILRPLAGDPDPKIRALAVAVATDPAVLARALEDAAPEVRAAAVAPLVKLAGVDAAAPKILSAIAAARDARERTLLARELLLALPASP